MKQKPIRSYTAKKYKSPYGIVDTQSSAASTIDPIVNFLKPRKHGIFLEIGVLGGSTLLGVYDTCKNRNIKVYGVDPWEKMTIANGFTKEEVGLEFWDKNMINKKSLREKLESIINKNNLDIELFHNIAEGVVSHFDDESIDCIHVDGNHSYEGVHSDMALFWPKLKPSGMMLMDDYHRVWPSVVRAVDEFIEDNKDGITTHKKHMNKMKIYKK